MSRTGLSVFEVPGMRTTTFESLSPAGPSTWTSAAGNPASRKRFAIARAAGVVLPSLYELLISMSCLKIARASVCGGVSSLCAATVNGASSASAREIVRSVIGVPGLEATQFRQWLFRCRRNSSIKVQSRSTSRMATTDPRIDAYIDKSPEFAKPILTQVRAMVHAACPDVEETMKWSMPHFYYEGQMLCGVAAFNEHAAVNFWKAALIEGLGPDSGGNSRGNLGKLRSVKDLPGKRQLS